MEEIRNIKNKIVCKIDAEKRIVEIVGDKCITIIEFLDKKINNKNYKVERLRKTE